MNDQSLRDDSLQNDEKRQQDDALLWEHGIDPSEVSPEERKDLVDDTRGEQLDDDDDQLSDVVPPEENDGND